MSKKVISFSLYGRHPKYTLGAIANARHANRAYPGWICRFYVADDIADGIVPRLQNYGAEVIKMGRYFGHEARLWRFFAAIDPEVEMTVFRDSDSRFSKCELLAVNEWLASGKKFHVMRSDALKSPIMAGLWGIRGTIPEVKDYLEKQLRSADPKGIRSSGDQWFLRFNLYPLMKGDVFIHEMYSQEKRSFFIGEPIHPFPLMADRDLEKQLPAGLKESYPFILPVGLRVSYWKTFIVLSIYKRTPFSEYFLAQLLGSLERQPIFPKEPPFDIRFYVADNIRPDLIERLRRLGQVVLRPATTVHKRDPQYWKLSILSENNLGSVAIVDFWQFLLLARGSRWKLMFYELPPIEHTFQPTGIKSQFGRIYPPSFYGPVAPVADIDNLVAQRNPDESYQEFVRSVVYPRTSTSRMRGVFVRRPTSVGAIKTWFRILSPLWFYDALGGLKEYLNARGISLKR